MGISKQDPSSEVRLPDTQWVFPMAHLCDIHFGRISPQIVNKNLGALRKKWLLSQNRQKNFRENSEIQFDRPRFLFCTTFGQDLIVGSAKMFRLLSF